MSIWTHVIGAVRFDGLPKIGLAYTVHNVAMLMEGKIRVEKTGLVLDNNKIPCGSEGPLQYKIYEHANGLPWITVAIWGDLRDYDDAVAIKKWFERVCSGWPLVRDGILRIQVEGQVAEVIEYREKETVA